MTHVIKTHIIFTLKNFFKNFKEIKAEKIYTYSKDCCLEKNYKNRSIIINTWIVHTISPFQSFSTLLFCMESTTSVSREKVGGRDFNGYLSHIKYLKFSGK
jgi:hypothetical protein